jgi:hypothetical protein
MSHPMMKPDTADTRFADATAAASAAHLARCDDAENDLARKVKEAREKFCDVHGIPEAKTFKQYDAICQEAAAERTRLKQQSEAQRQQDMHFAEHRHREELAAECENAALPPHIRAKREKLRALTVERGATPAEAQAAAEAAERLKGAS